MYFQTFEHEPVEQCFPSKHKSTIQHLITQLVVCFSGGVLYYTDVLCVCIIIILLVWSIELNLLSPAEESSFCLRVCTNFWRGFLPYSPSQIPKCLPWLHVFSLASRDFTSILEINKDSRICLKLPVRSNGGATLWFCNVQVNDPYLSLSPLPGLLSFHKTLLPSSSWSSKWISKLQTPPLNSPPHQSPNRTLWKSSLIRIRGKFRLLQTYEHDGDCTSTVKPSVLVIGKKDTFALNCHPNPIYESWDYLNQNSGWSALQMGSSIADCETWFSPGRPRRRESWEKQGRESLDSMHSLSLIVINWGWHSMPIINVCWCSGFHISLCMHRDRSVSDIDAIECLGLSYIFTFTTPTVLLFNLPHVQSTWCLLGVAIKISCIMYVEYAHSWILYDRLTTHNLPEYCKNFRWSTCVLLYLPVAVFKLRWDIRQFFTYYRYVSRRRWKENSLTTRSNYFY